MQQLFSIVIFCIVLFVYLHVQFHLKTSNDLEVYEIEHLVNDKTTFEEICDSRQPVVFKFSNDNIIKNKDVINKKLTSLFSFIKKKYFIKIIKKTNRK